MRKIFNEFIKSIVWRYLATLSPEKYKESLPFFNDFLDFVFTDNGE